jgi:hypothetical protein
VLEGQNTGSGEKVNFKMPVRGLKREIWKSRGDMQADEIKCRFHNSHPLFGVTLEAEFKGYNFGGAIKPDGGPISFANAPKSHDRRRSHPGLHSTITRVFP